MSIEELIARYGVVAVFVGSALEGETAAVTGGLFAHRHLIPFWAVTLATCSGSYLADQLCFLFGRRLRDHSGVGSIAASPAYAKALAALQRHPTRFILTFRFLYGVRTITAVAIGTSHVALARFATLDAIAGAVWGDLYRRRLLLRSQR